MLFFRNHLEASLWTGVVCERCCAGLQDKAHFVLDTDDSVEHEVAVLLGIVNSQQLVEVMRLLCNDTVS